ncbi:MAG: hypothetical protein E7369_04330 [Clostridiales bacterium]|nr:hypothetical protein [Clostridiales bacterium]
MSKWEEFEKDCCKYLKNNFSTYANFEEMGRKNSNVSDIKVVLNNGKEFYIETKKCPAQCGQFVVLPDCDKKEFVYSLQNDDEATQEALEIIEFMNKDFDSFSVAGTRGKKIDLDESIFAKWIIDHYTKKRVKYIITNDYKLFPLCDVANAFKITAKYRIKRSGSTEVSRGKMGVVMNYLDSLGIKDVFQESQKMFIKTEETVNKKRFVLDNYEYMFSKRDDRYEIRQLSNTYNYNVIFSVKLKKDYKGLDESDFIKALL